MAIKKFTGSTLEEQMGFDTFAIVRGYAAHFHRDYIDIPRLFTLSSIFTMCPKGYIPKELFENRRESTSQRIHFEEKPCFSIKSIIGSNNVYYSGYELSYLHYDVLMALFDYACEKNLSLLDPISISKMDVHRRVAKFPKNNRNNKALTNIFNDLHDASFRIVEGQLLDALKELWIKREAILNPYLKHFLCEELSILNNIEKSNYLKFRFFKDAIHGNTNDGSLTFQFSPVMLIFMINRLKVKAPKKVYESPFVVDHAVNRRHDLTRRLFGLFNSFGGENNEAFYDYRSSTWAKLLLSDEIQWQVIGTAHYEYNSPKGNGRKGVLSKRSVYRNKFINPLYWSLVEAELQGVIMPGWVLDFYDRPQDDGSVFATRGVRRPPDFMIDVFSRHGIIPSDIRFYFAVLIHYIGNMRHFSSVIDSLDRVTQMKFRIEQRIKHERLIGIVRHANDLNTEFTQPHVFDFGEPDSGDPEVNLYIVLNQLKRHAEFDEVIGSKARERQADFPDKSIETIETYLVCELFWDMQKRGLISQHAEIGASRSRGEHVLHIHPQLITDDTLPLLNQNQQIKLASSTQISRHYVAQTDTEIEEGRARKRWLMDHPEEETYFRLLQSQSRDSMIVLSDDVDPYEDQIDLFDH